MTQSRNAIGNLIARYNSVLTRCNILNHEIMKKIASTAVSTCFIFLGCLSGADAWAADLVVNEGTGAWLNNSGTHSYDSITNNKGIVQIGASGSTPTVNITGNFNNYADTVSLDPWGGPSWGIYGLVDLANGTLNISGTFQNEGALIMNGGTFEAVNYNNHTASDYTHINNGTFTVTGTITNNGYFTINPYDPSFSVNLNANKLVNTGGVFKNNGGDLNIKIIENTDDAVVEIFGGTLKNVESIKNTSNFLISDVKVNDSGSAITEIINGSASGNNQNAQFTLTDKATISVNTFSNYGKFYVNEGASAKFQNSITNASGLIGIHNLGSTVTINGNYTSLETNTGSTFHIASGEINPITPAPTNPTLATIEGNLYNYNGLVEVHNYYTTLTINGALGFINGTATTSGTLHTMQGALVDITTGGLHNVNGVVGVHGGTVKVANGTFTNDSKVKPAKDTAHNGVTETVHILHDGKLIAQILEQNAGDMGVGSTGLKGSEDTSYATFGTANSSVGTEINVHDDGIFTAQNGTIRGGFTIDAGTNGGVDGKLVVKTVTVADDEVVAATGSGEKLTLSSLHSKGDVDIQNGTLAISSGYNTGDTSEFTIASGATFTKKGDASKNMVISNKIVNQGTINVTGGGLVLEGLADAGTVAGSNQATYTKYTGHFVTEGDVIVNGPNAYLKLDAKKDGGAIDNEALNSLITNGYATSNSQHDSVTMKQASVLFYDGVGIVLAGNDAQLVVSNTAPVTSSNSVHFGDGTLFKFNGHEYSRENATITIDGAAGNIDISSTSKFFATNLIANKYYTIIENVQGYDQAELDKTGWAQSINGQDSLHRMIKDVRIEYVANGTHPNGTTDNQYKSNTNDIVLAAGGINNENFGVDEGIFESMKDLWEKEKNDKEGDNAGNGFVSDAASETVIPDDKEAGKTLESATNAAISGGVVHLTTDASDIMSQAVNVRMDGLHADSGGYAEDISATDWGIWAIPLYQQSQVRNIDIGKTTGGYDGWLAGVVAGIDRKKDEWTLGVALGIGIGEMESTDNFVDTDTDMDFWSAIAYAAYHKNCFEWKADFTYTNATSEITQANPYNLIAVAPIRADVDGQIFSLGTQISYKIIDDDVDVTPHIGLRYRAYRQDGYTTNIGGRELFDVKYADMDTLLLPAGVLLSTDFVWNDWLFTPRMDFVYTAFFGDTAINNYFGFAGSGDDVDAFGTVEMQSDILDDYMLSLSVGCGAKKDKWSFGLDFDFQRSENREAQAVFARVAYRW